MRKQVKSQLLSVEVDKLVCSAGIPTPVVKSPTGEERQTNNDSILGHAISSKFLARDIDASGLLCARDVGYALHDVGISLLPDEVGSHHRAQREELQFVGYLFAHHVALR